MAASGSKAPRHGLLVVMGLGCLVAPPLSAAGSGSIGPQVPAISTLWQAWSSLQPEEEHEKGTEAKKPARKWVQHVVLPGELTRDIEARYGVRKSEIENWNKKFKSRGYPLSGESLRIYARRIPPPREKVSYAVQFGDTWAKIAGKFGVSEDELRSWNRKVPRKFKAGTHLVVWKTVLPVDEGDGETDGPLPDFNVPAGGYALGKPNRGRLINGVQLPKSELYVVRDPEKAWGTSHTILHVQKAIADFRRTSGFSGDIVIGAISKRGGGRLQPHRSHQTGRDVDIRLPKVPGIEAGDAPAVTQIDWDASFRLIQSFIATGEVEYVFLDYSRQRYLYRAAKRAGLTGDELAKTIQYPRGPRENAGVVRHSEGHVTHVHVRIKCGPGSKACETY